MTFSDTTAEIGASFWTDARTHGRTAAERQTDIEVEIVIKTRIGAQCYKYTGRSDAYFFIHVQGPLEDSHFQTQLANTLDKRIC